MKQRKFEYNAVDYNYSDEYIQEMDRQGEHGWEVIQITDTGTKYRVFFKREYIVDPNEPKLVL